MATMQEIARLAARIMRTSDARRVYLGYPTLSDPDETHHLRRVPFLTIEHFWLYSSEWMELGKRDSIAQMMPETYHEYVFETYGLPLCNDLTLFRMAFNPFNKSNPTPFFYQMWLLARRYGWRFQKRGFSGAFGKDKEQLRRYPEKRSFPRARLLFFPSLPRA